VKVQLGEARSDIRKREGAIQELEAKLEKDRASLAKEHAAAIAKCVAVDSCVSLRCWRRCVVALRSAGVAVRGAVRRCATVAPPSASSLIPR
jgi:hypothetical protein